MQVGRRGLPSRRPRTLPPTIPPPALFACAPGPTAASDFEPNGGPGTAARGLSGPHPKVSSSIRNESDEHDFFEFCLKAPTDVTISLSCTDSNVGACGDLYANFPG